MIFAAGIYILDVVRIMLEHRQCADNCLAGIEEDDHRMTIGIALQPRPEFGPAAHPLGMIDALIVCSAEEASVANKRLGNARTGDHGQSCRIEHPIRDVIALAAEIGLALDDAAGHFFCCELQTDIGL